jgi:hypothetical protein
MKAAGSAIRSAPWMAVAQTTGGAVAGPSSFVHGVHCASSVQQITLYHRFQVVVVNVVAKILRGSLLPHPNSPIHLARHMYTLSHIACMQSAAAAAAAVASSTPRTRRRLRLPSFALCFALLSSCRAMRSSESTVPISTSGSILMRTTRKCQEGRFHCGTGR